MNRVKYRTHSPHPRASVLTMCGDVRFTHFLDRKSCSQSLSVLVLARAKNNKKFEFLSLIRLLEEPESARGFLCVCSLKSTEKDTRRPFQFISESGCIKAAANFDEKCALFGVLVGVLFRVLVRVH